MHICIKIALLGLVLAVLTPLATWADGPVTGSPFGVAYGEGSSNLDHFMDYVHDLGVTRTKVSFYWHEIEPEPGIYDFTALDQYLEQLGPDDQGLINLFTSGWCTQAQGRCKGSPIVGCPYEASDCEESCAERYREFVLAVAEHVKKVRNGGVVYWQRDTEPASPFPHFPANSPEAYVELQRIFYKAVKSVFPDAIVIGCNQNGDFTEAAEPANAPFFDYFLENASDWFDALDIRLYKDVYTIPERVSWFRDRMRLYGYEKPIVSTEQGGPDVRTMYQGGRSLFKGFLAQLSDSCSRRNVKWCFTAFLRQNRDRINPKFWPFYFPDDPAQEEIYERMQAADIIERNVVMLASGVEATWWWNLRSAGMDPIFGRMRLMSDDYQPLPGYDVYKRMVGTLGPVTDVTRIEMDDPSIYLYRVGRSDAGTPVYVAWHRAANADPYDAALAPGITAIIPIALSGPEIIDAMGNGVAFTGKSMLTVELSGLPLFIVGGQGS